MRNLSRAALLIFFWLGTAGIFSTNFIFAAEKIDINSAPLEDLVKIIHIGEARALELISLRPFSSLDELVKIKGIGEARLRDIKEEGLAWVGPPQAEGQPESNSQLKPELQPIEESKIQAEPKPITYPSGIVINEVLPNPEGIPDAEGEWIEIFNQNNFEVLLSEWKITDTEGKITTFSFPKETKISSQGFLVFWRTTTKITLNNDGDGLKLIQPDGKIVDEAVYEKAPRGQSYNRTNSGWAWSTNLTPGAVNFIPLSKAEEKTEAESLKDKSTQEPETKRELAAIGLQISKPSKLYLFY